MAAESYFRLSGKLAAVNVTTGPGGINALNGVFGAYTDSLGMMVISGQVKFETTLKSTSVPLRQLGDQEVDIVRMAEGITKYAVMVTEPETFIQRAGNHFVLRVRGNSMIDEQIRDGDFVVINERQAADNGETVIALIDNTSATVKKFYRERDGRIRLQPANETMLPIYVHENDVTIQGVVVGVLRKY